MNTFFKIVLAILGGCNVVLSLFLPMAITILWILKFPMGNFGNNVLLIIGILATLYKGIDFLFIREKEYG